MKKLIALITALFILFPVSALANDVDVYINGKEVEFDQPPIIYEDLTFVPFRNIFESLGMVVQWNDDEKCATAFNKSYRISFIMDYDYIFVNDLGHPITHGPIIRNSRLLVPLRSLINAVNGQIYWDENSRSVLIYTSEAVDDSDWGKEVLALTNQFRAEYGLPALSWSDELAEVGREHCIDMAARGYFDHVSPEGTTPFDLMHSNGIWPTYAGENIAAGQFDPTDVVNSWINSPEHKENMLTTEYTQMGAAFYRGGDYGIYWAQEFAG